MTRLPLSLLAVFVLVSACGGDSSGSEPSASGNTPSDSASVDSTGSSGTPVRSVSTSDSSDADKGFFQSALDLLLSHPRKEREGRQTSDCETDADYSGRSLPYHSIVIDNGNGFNTTHEAFQTSSPDAQTPYVAYASWDPCSLALGLTGSAVGAGDCSGDGCLVIDQAESAYRYWVIYLDTDPQGSAGTQWPRKLGPVPERLPFRADYMVEVRLDGVTRQIGDGMTYQGNAQLYSRTSDWSVGLEESWQSMGRGGLVIGDNSSSNFIEMTVDREALGDPCAIQAVGWVVDTRADTLFAHWPPPRGMRFGAESGPRRNTGTRATRSADATRSRTAARDTAAGTAGRTGPRNTAAGPSASDSASAGATRAPSRRTSESSSDAKSARPTPADSLVLDVYGFMLTEGQAPNAKGNLNRTDFSLVETGCTTPSRPTR